MSRTNLAAFSGGINRSSPPQMMSVGWVIVRMPAVSLAQRIWA